MIWACRGASAMPFIRVPDATEGAIQKATDIGALSLIVRHCQVELRVAEWADDEPAAQLPRIPIFP